MTDRNRRRSKGVRILIDPKAVPEGQTVTDVMLERLRLAGFPNPPEDRGVKQDD